MHKISLIGSIPVLLLILLVINLMPLLMGFNDMYCFKEVIPFCVTIALSTACCQ